MAYEVTRANEGESAFALKAIITAKTTTIYDGFLKAGRHGVTTRDWPGYDLRHYIRVMRNKGIAITDEWEGHEDGQHKRWFLADGHSHREIAHPKKTKPATAATVQASDSITQETNLGGLNVGEI